MSIKYHATVPDSQKNSYVEFDNVDFTLKYPGREIVANSIRIVGNVIAKVGAVNLDPNTPRKIFFDNFCGSHNFFQTITSSCDRIGNIEILDQYPRWVKSTQCASFNEEDMFNSTKICELKCPREVDTFNLLAGECVSNYDPDNMSYSLAQSTDFYMKPDICFNNVDTNLSYSRFGNIKVSVRLARNIHALFGAENTALNNVSYELQNLKCYFMTVPDEGLKPIKMNIKHSIVQSISSASSVVQVRAPIVCNAVSLSFMPQSEANSYTENTNELQVLPGLDTIMYEYNGMSNELLGFELKNLQEINYFTEQAFRNIGVNNFSLDKIENNKSQLVAFAFPYQQLLNNKIAINISSGIQSSFNTYVFLHGLIEF